MGFYTRFYDTSGCDRCVGRMPIFIDDGGGRFASRSTWSIDGTVSGYTCSTVGRTFELQLQQTQ
ncbi:MAG: hypothetical protein HC895_04585 [Leptolyngbyaceae cyanobacterium SM1_3_5]|nr:hypothetical protein [Leptolyngbyaceae cyanobacterium SM1_3_5]